MGFCRRVAGSLLRKISGFQVRALAIGLSKDYSRPMDSENRNMSSLVSIVVAVNDAPTVVERCLTSLSRNAGGAQVILVNDGSQESTRTVIDKYSKRCSWLVVNHLRPEGHSKACRSGVAIADRPIVCLLNSDTVVPSNCWSGILGAFAHSRQIAVVGPSTSHASTPQCLQPIAGQRFDWSDGQIEHFSDRCLRFGGSYCWPGPRNGQNCISVPEISGFAFFIRRKIWNEFGGFDSQFDDYGNETELCLRLLKAGYGLSWAPRSYIHHLGKQSYGRSGQDAVEQRRVRASALLAASHGSNWREQRARSHAPDPEELLPAHRLEEDQPRS